MCQAGHNAAVKNFVDTRKGRMVGHENELQVLRKNGETFPASISFSVAEVDQRLFFTGIVRDLTETKAMQEKVIQAERLAILGQTVAEINHEIKNPLLMIGGFARQLLKIERNEKESSKLQVIVAEVERLEKLLAELRNFYRPRELELSVSDLNDLLREVVALAEARQDHDKIDIRLETSEEILVEIDREKIKQVLLNLVKNSMEALAEEGGKITIRSLAEGNRVKVVVTDSGPGIPRDVQEKLFKPFFTTKASGTGLGLCISKRIVEDHPDSSLDISSREGEGTSVTISLCCSLGKKG
jgi:C4-dicarboxylate-specific signal transduction histidine kinase